MGTPDFATTILDALAQTEHTIVGVITVADKPAGRGRKIQQSSVKQYCEKHNLNVLQPTNLKDEEFIATLAALKADLQIVVAFRMLPQVVWQMPKLGTFNLHASLLPHYRGAAPINWAIIEGEKTTGVTSFFIDDKIDTGEIIMQEKIAIEPNENAGELHDKLMHLGAAVVLKTVKAIATGEAKPIKQSAITPLKLAHKIHKETCKIDWEQPVDRIYDFIRGMSPYPAAWCKLVTNNTEQVIKLFKTTKELCSHNEKIGSVFADKTTFKIAVNGGYLFVDEIQLAGKRRMTTKDILNGFSVSENSYVL